MDNRPEILSVMVLSTAHLRESDCARLTSTPLELWPVAGGIVDCGYLIYGHGEDCENGIEQFSAPLWACLQYARAQGCDYVKFDADVEPLDDLPIHDWT